MKKSISITKIKKMYKNVFSCGAADLHHLMQLSDPDFYNVGVCGWNCDIYTNYQYDIALTTGYRNTAGKKIPRDTIKKYETVASRIIKDNTDYDLLYSLLEDLRDQFYQELLTL